MIANKHIRLSRESNLGAGDTLNSLAGIPSVQTQITKQDSAVRETQIRTAAIRNATLGDTATMITKLPENQIKPKDAVLDINSPVVIAWCDYFHAEYGVGVASLEVSKNEKLLIELTKQRDAWKAFKDQTSNIFPAATSSVSPIVATWATVKKNYSVIEDTASKVTKFLKLTITVPALSAIMTAPTHANSAKFGAGYKLNYWDILDGYKAAQKLKDMILSIKIPKIGMGAADSANGKQIEIELENARNAALAAADAVVTAMYGLVDTVNSTVSNLEMAVSKSVPQAIVNAGLKLGVANSTYQKAFAVLVERCAPYLGSGDKATLFATYDALPEAQKQKNFPAVYKASIMGLIKFEGEMAGKKSDEAAVLGAKLSQLASEVQNYTNQLVDLDNKRTEAKAEREKLLAQYANASSEAEKEQILAKLAQVEKKIADLARDILVRGRALNDKRGQTEELVNERSSLRQQSTSLREGANEKRTKSGIDLGGDFGGLLNKAREQNEKTKASLDAAAAILVSSGKTLLDVFSRTDFPPEVINVAQNVFDTVKTRTKTFDNETKSSGGVLPILAILGYALSR